MWQDYVFAIGNWVFVIAMIPTIRNPHKPPLSASVTTAVTIFVFAITFWTLGMYASVITSSALCGAWSVVAYQKWRGN